MQGLRRKPNGELDYDFSTSISRPASVPSIPVPGLGYHNNSSWASPSHPTSSTPSLASSLHISSQSVPAEYNEAGSISTGRYRRVKAAVDGLKRFLKKEHALVDDIEFQEQPAHPNKKKSYRGIINFEFELDD